MKTIEYVTPAALECYRGVADVRRSCCANPGPPRTGLVCEALLRPQMLIEVHQFSTETMALLNEELKAWIGRETHYPAARGAGPRLDPLFRARDRRQHQRCSLTGIFLPAADRDIHVSGIQLKGASIATGAFRCNQDGPATAEWVEHKTATPRAVFFDHVGNPPA